MYIFKKNDHLYDWISNVIDNQLYFGPFPSQEMKNKLFENKFDLLVNLTEKNDINIHLKQVNPPPGIDQVKIKTIDYPIRDNSYPNNAIEYCIIIYNIFKELLSGKKIYVYCMAGHGRSSTVCTSIISCMFGYNLDTALDIISKAHNSRIVLREKWLKRKYPMNYFQYMFLVKMHKDIFFDIDNKWITNGEFYGKILQTDKVNDYENIDSGNIKDLVIKDPKNSFFILYNYFFDKISKNKELNYKIQLTYLRKIIIINCDNYDVCKVYGDVLKCIREYFQQN